MATGRGRKGREDPAGGRRTSLKHLAALTGFSITTVSMVLNGRAEEFAISAETRDLVLAAAREHNYRPNLHARSLRNRTTNILGLMVPTLSNGFFSEMAETFERLARRDQKLALVTVTNYQPQEELDTLNYFLSQDVECVFTANPVALEDVAELCRKAGTRQILLDAQESERPTVSTDNREASLVLTRTLLRSLVAAGRGGRVYFVGGPADHEVTKLRVAGFGAALAEEGLPCAEDQVVPTRFDPDSGYQGIERLFRTRSDIAGLFVNSLIPMGGLVRFFGEAPELCRPLHYGIFDYHPIMDLLVDLHLASIKQDPGQMMEEAYRIQASGEAQGPLLRHIPYQLVLSPAMRRFVPEPRARPARARVGRG